MIILGLTYAIVEEASVTQSLFNPNFVGLRLLDYGYVSGLGISIRWTVFVLGIHTIWSTAVPIALVESLVPQIRHTPWLRPAELALTAIIFVVGCVIGFLFQQQQDAFMASDMQRLASAGIVVVLIVIAIALGRQKGWKINTRFTTRPLPSARAVGAIVFLLGSAFMSLAIAHDAIPAGLNAAGMISLILFGERFSWRGRSGQGGQHTTVWQFLAG